MRNEFRRGFAANLPLAASVAAYGSVMGVLAAQKGLTWFALAFMNLAIFAGSAQFVMVDMWTRPLPIWQITFAVLAVNMRYLLIGASLSPVLAGQRTGRKLAMMHLVVDENWATTMAERRRGFAGVGFLLGGGVCIFLAWCGGTLAGNLFGAVIENPEAYALDFAFIAVFTALCVKMWRGRRDLVPWAATFVLAVAAEKVLPGKWYIIVGGMGGAAAAMFAPLDEETGDAA